jgi:hypothetical protein
MIFRFLLKFHNKPARKELLQRPGSRQKELLHLAFGCVLKHLWQHQIDMDEGVFGFPHSEIIAKEDMEQIFRHLELGIGVMHSYIWYSDQSII